MVSMLFRDLGLGLYYIYSTLSNTLKISRSGTFRQLHVVSKAVPIYCTCNHETDHDQPALNQRCHVHLLDLYISKLPEKTRAEQVLFYVRPLQHKPQDETSPWFYNVPETTCLRAGIEGKKTNHSLQATGASKLFYANVPEKMIQERTGHRSVVAQHVLSLPA